MDYTMVRSPQWECERLSETWGEKKNCLSDNKHALIFWIENKTREPKVSSFPLRSSFLLFSPVSKYKVFFLFPESHLSVSNLFSNQSDMSWK